MNYPWYQSANGLDLEQGDIFFGCPVIKSIYPSVSGGEEQVEVTGTWEPIDLVLLTQSCDLAQSKIESVLLCPVYDFNQFMEVNSKFSRSEIWKGHMPGLHLLNEIDLPEHKRGVLVASFKHLVTIPFGYLREVAADSGSRPRLCPPYREHLAEAFGRSIMRVGLPSNIPKQKIGLK